MSGENDDDLLTIDLEGEGDQTTQKDPVDDLKEQAERLQRERDEQEARAQRAERAASDARREADQARSQVAETQVDAIGNAIAAEEAAIAAAKRDYAAALAEGDYDKAAETQAVLSTAAAKLVRLHGDKEDFETRKAAPPARDASGDPVESYIRQMVGPGRSQDWLLSHPDCITDPIKNARMMAAHHEAIADGVTPDTDAYFERIETKLGLRGASDDDAEPAPKPAPATTRKAAPNYSAPPSRDPPSPSGRQSTTRITLTSAQRDMAESLGMTPTEYAKHLIDLRNEGKMAR